jgi:hypothetical protein
VIGSAAAASLSISDGATYNYGLNGLGSVTSKTFTITNVGTSEATSMADGLALVAPYSFSGGSYPGTGGTCSTNLDTSLTCTLVVDFSPTSSGTFNDTLEVDYFDGQSTITATRALSGSAAGAVLSISDGATYNYGSKALGSVTSKTFTITNSGITAAASVGDGAGLAAPFVFKDGTYPGTGGTCTGTLASLATCTIVVNFEPTVQVVSSDTLDVSYDDGSGTTLHATRAVSGEGSLAVLSISDGPTFDYGIKAPGTVNSKTFTITNTGGLQATSIGDGAGLAAPFNYKDGSYPGTGGSCLSTLNPLATCTVVIDFSPSSAAISTDTLLISYDDGQATQNASRDLSGEGALAVLAISDGPTFDYGSKSLGTTTSKTFTVSNTGGFSASSLSGGGLTAPFTFQGGTYPGTGGSCLTTLAAAASCTIVVDFSPTVSGAQSDSIEISYNDGQSAQMAAGAVQGTGDVAILVISDGATYNFGNVVVNGTAEKTLTVSNTGGAQASAIADAGALAAPYAYKGGGFPGTGGTCVSTLGAGGTCTLVIQFTPESTGVLNDTLVLDYNDSVTAQTSSRGLTGSGVRAVLAITDSPTYNFGTIVTGQIAERTFTISNSGGYAASSLLDTAALAAPFRYKGTTYPGTGGTCSTGLSAGGSCTLVLEYAPTLAGSHSDTLDISFNDGVSSTNLTLAVTGVAAAAANLSISDSPSYNYGNVDKNTVSSKTFTITNGGGVTAASVADGAGLAAPLLYKGGSYPGTGGTCGSSINASASCTVVIDFSPTTVAAASDTLLINYNDGVVSQQLSQGLTGAGINTAPVAAALSLTVYKSTTNNALTVSATDVNSDSMTYSIVAGPTNGTVGSQNGDSAFTYTPTVGYVGSDSFTFRANDGLANSNTATVSITVENWWSATWKKRRKVTIDNSSIATNLTNFPILVKINSARVDYTQTQNAGQDIRFVDADHSTVLSHEIEVWNESGDSYVWVKVPQIDASSATDHIYMYYGNAAAADGQSAAAVWSNGFLTVLHMNQTSTTHNDVTGNAHDFVSSGTVGTATGMIAGARDFTGGTSGPIITDSDGELYINGLAAITISMWLRATTPATTMGLLRTDNRTDLEELTMSYSATNSRVQTYTKASSSVTAQSVLSSNSKHATSWQHFAFTWATGATSKQYFNGVLDTPTSSGANVTGTIDSADRIEIGNTNDITNEFNGQIDEIRFSNVARSADWLKAEEKTGSDNFYCGYGSEITIP